ncbi:Conserved_hypothetical protein [Hexamita inflata]|uniref:Uncharacterized protein n=1 Tax=Hexamita inflata TaxID=28002 RepID=A0AA86NU43_9EUKA|nr:Conserved hypothetical protein [Hexamita inflata]CAI9925988.1 Conserved hypothetical protein [Hexamita inflata]
MLQIYQIVLAEYPCSYYLPPETVCTQYQKQCGKRNETKCVESSITLICNNISCGAYNITTTDVQITGVNLSDATTNCQSYVTSSATQFATYSNTVYVAGNKYKCQFFECKTGFYNVFCDNVCQEYEVVITDACWDTDICLENITTQTCFVRCNDTNPYFDADTLDCRSSCPFYKIFPAYPTILNCTAACDLQFILDANNNHQCVDSCVPPLAFNYGTQCVNPCPADKPFLEPSTSNCTALCASKDYVLDTTKTQTKNCSACTKYFIQDGVQRQCVNACPSSNPYLLGSQCYATCPSPTVYAEVNKTCVSTCASGFFSVGTGAQTLICQTTCSAVYVPDAASGMNKCQTSCPGTLPYTNGKLCVNVCPADKPYLDGTDCKATCTSLSYTQNTSQLQQLVCQSACSGFYYVNGTQKRCVSICDGFYMKMECVLGGCNSTYPVVSVNECRANCSAFNVCNQAKTFNNKLLLYCDGDQYSASNTFQGQCLSFQVPTQKFDNTIKTVYLYQKRMQNANINVYIAKESVTGYEIYLIAKQDTLLIIESKIAFAVETNSLSKFAMVQKSSSLKIAGCTIFVQGEAAESAGIQLKQIGFLSILRSSITAFTKATVLSGGICGTFNSTTATIIEDLTLVVMVQSPIAGGIFGKSLQALTLTLNRVSIIGKVAGTTQGSVFGKAITGTVVTATSSAAVMVAATNVCGANECTVTGL